MNDEAVYRTAPATPGLLNIGEINFTLKVYLLRIQIFIQYNLLDNFLKMEVIRYTRNFITIAKKQSPANCSANLRSRAY